MRKYFAIITVLAVLSPLAPTQAAKAAAEKVYTVSQLSGNLLLEKNSDRIWYAEPLKNIRYIIRDDADVKWLRDNLTTTITSATFAKIPNGVTATAKKYTGKYIGRLVTKANTDESWYVNPATGKRYLFDTFDHVQQLSEDLGITVGSKSLVKLAMTKKQVMFDPVSVSLGYVRYTGDHFVGGKNSTAVLPLASLTKLMTALVLLDLNLDFDKKITITADEINYPKTLVGDDATSEVPLQTGDTVETKDLWTSMLLASSNQSAIILADNSGVTRSDFVQRMNDKARSFGLTKTLFFEPAGLNANNVTTPQEMAILANRAFNSLRIASEGVKREIHFTVTGSDGTDRTISVANRNYSLLAFNPDAAKTGFLVEAQRNAAIKKDGEIIVVMHAASMKQRNQSIQKLLP